MLCADRLVGQAGGVPDGLEKPSKYTLTSWLSDEPFSVKARDGQVWTPQNYDRRSAWHRLPVSGPCHSYNLSTAKLGLEVGVPNVLKTLGRLG